MRIPFFRSPLRDEKGATAVEFALIAPLFFSFILGIIDISAYFFTAGQLQHATIQAARDLRVGNATVVGNSDTQRDAFINIFCSKIPAGLIHDCEHDIRVDVTSYGRFSDIPNPPPTAADYDANGNNTIEEDEVTYGSGGASCAVVVRSFYGYKTIFPGLQNLMAAVVPDSFYIASATAFRNEPFTNSPFASCGFE